MTAPAVIAAVSEQLVAEFFSPDDLARLHRAAERVADGGNEAFLRVDDLDEALDRSRCRVLITSWGAPRLDEELLASFPRLGLVAHTGASIRFFATEAMFDRGIVVTQAGAGMARSVAEVSLAFTVALLHRIPHMHDNLRGAAGGWHVEGMQHEILGAPIAVIGASRTGRSYLELIRALGARALLVDPTVTEDEARALGARLVSLDEALSRCRIAALHAPSLPETRHLIGAAELARMPDGSGLVNTARSWLVDESALLAELARGRLSAAIDVFDEEPLPADNPFRTAPGVLLTPHRAAGTVEGRLRQGRIIADEVEAFTAGTPLRHAITREQLAVMA